MDGLLASAEDGGCLLGKTWVVSSGVGIKLQMELRLYYYHRLEIAAVAVRMLGRPSDPFRAAASQYSARIGEKVRRKIL